MTKTFIQFVVFPDEEYSDCRFTIVKCRSSCGGFNTNYAYFSEWQTRLPECQEKTYYTVKYLFSDSYGL